MRYQHAEYLNLKKIATGICLSLCGRMSAGEEREASITARDALNQRNDELAELDENRFSDLHS